MDPKSPLLSSFIGEDFIKSIDGLDIRDNEERKKRVYSVFKTRLKKKWFSATILTFFTLGLYLYKLRKKSEADVKNLISARKLIYFDKLVEKIESIREKTSFSSPKSAIHHIYKNLINDPDFPLTKIYSKSDLLLYITTPIDSTQYEEAKNEIQKTKDYYRFWKTIKQNTRHQEITYVKNINSHYALLKNRYLLPKEEIHSRLIRTLKGNNPASLSLLKSLSDAFQEVTTAFESLVSLKKQDFDSFELMTSLVNLNSKEAEEIHDVLSGSSKLSELSIDNLRYLLSLIIRKQMIISIYENIDFSHILLTLNELQLQVISKLYNQLINSEAFSSKLMKCFYEKLKPCDNFTSKLCPEKKVHSQITFKEENEQQNLELTMTKNFLDEMNTKWEHIDVSHAEDSYSFNAEQNISFDHLSKVHKTLANIAGKDKELLFILQEALSKKGKKIIVESMRDSIKEILGEEKVCFDLNLSNIKIHKINPEYLEIEYYFDKPGVPGNSFAPSIIQPLKKSNGVWISD